MTVNDDLKEDIKKGASLQKVPEGERKRREEEKRNRLEELKLLQEKLK